MVATIFIALAIIAALILALGLFDQPYDAEFEEAMRKKPLSLNYFK